MVATTALIPAPPLLAPSPVGRLFTQFPPIEASDPHVGLGVVFERDVQINGTAVWDGNACEVAGTDKTGDEIAGTAAGIPYTVFQMAHCRMLNEWDSLGGRLGDLFEIGEQRTVEEAFAAALIAGDYGTPAAGPTATDAGPRAAFAIAEKYIRTQMAYGVILASPEVVMYGFSKDELVRNGDRVETELGTPVVALPGLGDDLYVTGQVNIWRGSRSEPRPVQEIPFTNEFDVLTERIYTISVEGDAAAMPIVKWTVTLTVA